MSNIFTTPSLWKNGANVTPPTEWNATNQRYEFLDSSGGPPSSLTYIGTFPTSAFQISALVENDFGFPESVIVIADGVTTTTNLADPGPTLVDVPACATSLVIQGQHNFGGQPPSFYADVYLSLAVPPPVAPNLSVKVPNESTGTPITPQIVSSGLPVQGYTLAIVTQPTNGTVTVSTDGTGFIYTPTLGTTQVPDSFTYTATYGGEVSNTATVNLYVFTQYNCACDMNDEPGEGFPTFTLDQMQRRVLVRLGMAAMPTPPSGMAETINTFLEDAQTELYRMYKCFRLKRWFTWQLQQGVRFYDWNADIENVNMLVPAPSGLAVVPTTGTGTLAAGPQTYAITALNDNGETTPGLSVTGTLSAVGEFTLTWSNQANVKGFNVYRMANNGPYGEAQLSFLAYVNNALSYVDNGSVAPTTQVPPSANSTSICSKTLDPRQIDGVYISRGDNVWQPLFEGIPPTMYTSKIQAIPQRYEIRQCIEIWPAPSDDTWQLRITGDFALRPFNQPRDVTTIDPHATYLKAIADAAVHYGKVPVAQATAQSLEMYIKKLIAGTDSNTRLWPGTGVVINAIPPKMAGT